ncbi:GntR family transcriptional regulator [Falsiroseomonas stagni]|uniref:DNA-binding transcriptional regulator, GntR family n=1 Tax=Falsiroseomonas stagni DSM 19981 TaxID=1123062 RepID=A0A1I4AWA1_9PROT|nr:GntR family transcriptional regulator [Falsiroseomonas stagni]SFK60704.1 DNA-binding transcriptional regulator, GntR family [Falsiroseomonas stagni DSM 19981]
MPDHGGASANSERFRATIHRVLSRGEAHASLVIDIACTIGAEILDGLLPPGRDLNSVDLARRFSTSRTPVREALVMLEKEGLVEIPPRRRPRVAIHDRDEIREIYRVRAAMLGLCASEACEHASAEELVELRDIVTAMQDAANTGDRDGYYWGNVRFHERFAELARNRTLLRQLDSLVLRSLRFRRRTLSSPERVRRSIADHSRLVVALEDRDQALASALASANVLGALRMLEAMLDGEARGEPRAAAKRPISRG